MSAHLGIVSKIVLILLMVSTLTEYLPQLRSLPRWKLNYIQGSLTFNQYGDNIILFNLYDGCIKHQIKQFITSRKMKYDRNQMHLTPLLSVFHCCGRPSWLETILWMMSEALSSAAWELSKCGRGSTGQCTLYPLYTQYGDEHQNRVRLWMVILLSLPFATAQQVYSYGVLSLKRTFTYLVTCSLRMLFKPGLILGLEQT